MTFPRNCRWDSFTIVTGKPIPCTSTCFLPVGFPPPLLPSRNAALFLIRLLGTDAKDIPQPLSPNEPCIYLLVEVSDPFLWLLLQLSCFAIQLGYHQQSNQTPEKMWGHVPHQPPSSPGKRETPPATESGIWEYWPRRLYFDQQNIL